MPALDPLAAFRAADPPYQQAREELRALEYARDLALLDARRSGLDEEGLRASTGLEAGELRAALARASAAAAGQEMIASEASTGSPNAVTLTAVYEPDDGGWVSARLVEWPGVITAGRDRREAAALLRDAAREWLLSLADEAPRQPAGAEADYESIEVAVR